MISAALSLAAAFAPKIIGLISGDKAEAIAATVVSTAQAITGTDNADAAQTALQNNPDLALKFRESANHLQETIIEQQGATLRAAIDADKDNPQSTRPRIALGAFHVVAAISLVVISLWSVAVGSGNVAMVKQIVDGWPLALAVTGPFVALLRAYFGILRHEQREKMQAGTGQPISAGIGSMLSRAMSEMGDRHGK